MAATTYFTLSDERFFPGAVAMMNSLRLTGNHGELVVLDRGLTVEQRRLLGPHARIHPVDPQIHPFLVTASIRKLADSGTLCWIDGDILLTRGLDHMRALTEIGKVCMYPDSPANRWHSEWQEVFALRRPLRRETYLNAGLWALSIDHWADLLERWSELCELIPQTSVNLGQRHNPFLAGDQDALNALLMSEVPRAQVAELPAEEMVCTGVMHQARIVDRKTLVCSRKGREVALLHYQGKLKPWMSESWGRVNRDAYVRLLLRLWYEEDVPLRLPPRYVPSWLRPTTRGRLLLGGLRVVHGPRARLQDAARVLVHRLPAPVREPILRFRGRIIHGHR